MKSLVTEPGDGLDHAAPTWAVVASGLLSLFGLGVSIYLTWAHFAGANALVCPASGGLINCEKVTTSGESYFLHIPVALLGLVFYLGYSALNSPWAWRAADRRVHLARFAAALLGMGFALWLVSAELLIIKNICLWCTSIHLITFLLFVIVVTTVPSMLGWGAERG